MEAPRDISQGRGVMKQFRGRMFGWIAGSLFSLTPALALAEGSGGGYRGIAQIYFTFILAILIYGVHDAFHSRKVTIASAVVLIVIVFVFLLPKT